MVYSQTKIAIPILKEDKTSILNEAEKSIIRGADLIELRIDGMKNPNPDLIKEIIYHQSRFRSCQILQTDFRFIFDIALWVGIPIGQTSSHEVDFTQWLKKRFLYFFFILFKCFSSLSRLTSFDADTASWAPAKSPAL